MDKEQAARKIQRALRRRYVLNTNGGLARDPVTYDAVHRGEGVLLNKKWYLADTVKEMIERGHRRVPHTQRQLTAHEIDVVRQRRKHANSTDDEITVILAQWALSKLCIAPFLCDKVGRKSRADNPQAIGDMLIVWDTAGSAVKIAHERYEYGQDNTEQLYALVSSQIACARWIFGLRTILLGRTADWNLTYRQQRTPRQTLDVDMRTLSDGALEAFYKRPFYNYLDRLWERARETHGANNIMNLDGYLVDDVYLATTRTQLPPMLSLNSEPLSPT